jgi:hypothetical protein
MAPMRIPGPERDQRVDIRLSRRDLLSNRILRRFLTRGRIGRSPVVAQVPSNERGEQVGWRHARRGVAGACARARANRVHPRLLGKFTDHVEPSCVVPVIVTSDMKPFSQECFELHNVTGVTVLARSERLQVLAKILPSTASATPLALTTEICICQFGSLQPNAHRTTGVRPHRHPDRPRAQSVRAERSQSKRTLRHCGVVHGCRTYRLVERVGRRDPRGSANRGDRHSSELLQPDRPRIRTRAQLLLR